MFEVKLPKIRDEADESLVVIWLVSEGDTVEKGDALLEIQTEKEVTEIEAEVGGTIREIRVKRGDTAKVGEVLAVIDPEGNDEEHASEEQQLVEQENQDEGESGPHKPEEQQLAEKKEEQQAGRPEQTGSASKVTPGMRKLAKELGVRIETVEGSGRNGKITEADIRLAAGNDDGKPEGAIPLSGIRGTIAKRMVESLQSSAQLTETAWADITELKKRREQQSDMAGWTSLAAKAAAMALAEHPLLNAHIKESQILPKKEINLGFAIDAKNGLQVAVIHNCSELSPKEMEEQLKMLAEKARSNQLSREDQVGGTFTITSLGAQRVQFFTPIINPPEVAILGLGKIEPHVVLQNGEVTERYRMPLSLTFDHRAIDGAPAAAFLSELITILEEPERLLEKRVNEV